ncbi:hypothetical protein ACA910_011228 [Epithemia clementina (nom. ined.)]
MKQQEQQEQQSQQREQQQQQQLPAPCPRRRFRYLSRRPNRLLLALVVLLLLLLSIYVDAFSSPTDAFPVALAQTTCSVQDKHGNRLNLNGPLPEGILFDPNLNKVICRDDYSCAGFTISGCQYVNCLGSYSCEKARLPNNFEVTCGGDYACHLVLALGGHDFRCGENGAKQSCNHAAFQTDSHVYCIYNGACDQDSWDDRLHVHVGRNGRLYCLSDEEEAKDPLPCRNILVEVPSEYRACFSLKISSAAEKSRCSMYCHPSFDTSCDLKDVKFMQEQPPN